MNIISAFAGKELPLDLKIAVLGDVIDGNSYLHSKRIVQVDIKPLNVLVIGDENDEFTFKVADYGCIIINPGESCNSTTLKQLMTSRCMAPKLFSSHCT